MDNSLIKEENKKEEFTPPYKIAIIDLFDCYHYADIVSQDRYSWLGWQDYANYVSYDGIVELSDRLFWALNPEASTQEEWYEWDAGYDVRVYDKNNNCVYKAHEKLPKKSDKTDFPENLERSKRLKQLKLKAFNKMQELRGKRKAESDKK